MINQEELKNFLEEILLEKQMFLVELKISKTLSIDIRLDKMEGISIDETSEICHKIVEKFTPEIEDYDLEVSSPGLSDTFKVLQQYQKNIGKEVEVLATSGEKIKGILFQVDDNQIVVSQTKTVKIDNKKTKVEEKITINFSDIKQTKLVLKV